MTGITEIPRIPVSDLAAQLPQASMADGAKDAIVQLRQNGLKNRDATRKLDQKGPDDPVAEAREALRPGHASLAGRWRPAEHNLCLFDDAASAPEAHLRATQPKEKNCFPATG